MSLEELLEKLERIKELRTIGSHRLTDREIDELHTLETIMVKIERYNE